MCGRFTSITSPTEVASFFSAVEPNPNLFGNFAPNYNVAPTTRIMAIANDQLGARRVGLFQWGLVPSWAKVLPTSQPLINARSETAHEKPSFRESLPHRRCLIAVDGFFEWRTVDIANTKPPATKQPVYVNRRDGRLLALAGLWATWRDTSDPSPSPWLHSCCILTTSANATMSPIHDRMPVILASREWSAWLNTGSTSQPATSMTEIVKLMKPADASILSVAAVGTSVNSIRNNSADLLLPVI